MQRFALCLAATLIGCATPKEAVEWKPEPGRPIVVDFGYGGAFSTQTRYVADGVRACRENGEPRKRRDGATHYPLTRQVEVVPSAERWTAFWRAIDYLGVSHWKPEYSLEEIGEEAFDGTQWSVSFSTLRATSESRGDNAYPTIGHPKRTTSNDAAFRKLQEAFEALIDTPKA
jgi:hypothetical protein